MTAVRLDAAYARFQAQVRHLGDGAIREAAADALSRAALDVRRKMAADLPAIFSKAVPFTQAAMASRGANARSLTATVFVKPLQARYLLREEEGGTRTPADSPNGGQALVLPNRIPLNSYNNIPFKALARLRAQAERDVQTRRRLQARIASSKSGSKAREKAVAKAAQQTTVVFLPASAVRGPFAKIGGYFRRLPDHKLVRLTSFQAQTEYRPKFGFHDRIGTEAAPIVERHLRDIISETLAKVIR